MHGCFLRVVGGRRLEIQHCIMPGNVKEMQQQDTMTGGQFGIKAAKLEGMCWLGTCQGYVFGGPLKLPIV